VTHVRLAKRMGTKSEQAEQPMIENQ